MGFGHNFLSPIFIVEQAFGGGGGGGAFSASVVGTDVQGFTFAGQPDLLSNDSGAMALGDLSVLWLVAKNLGSDGQFSGFGGPSSTSQLGPTLVGGAGNNIWSSMLYYKVATAADVGSTNVSLSLFDTYDEWMAVLLRFRRASGVFTGLVTGPSFGNTLTSPTLSDAAAYLSVTGYAQESDPSGATYSNGYTLGNGGFNGVHGASLAYNTFSGGASSSSAISAGTGNLASMNVLFA